LRKKEREETPRLDATATWTEICPPEPLPKLICENVPRSQGEFIRRRQQHLLTTIAAFREKTYQFMLRNNRVTLTKEKYI